MILLFFILTSFLVFDYISNNQQSEEIKITDSQHPINLELKQKAQEIFGNILILEGSYSSYSSHDVLYSIHYKDFSIADFLIYHDEILKKNEWVFLKKMAQSYIYCQNSRQLEIIPPKILIKNVDNEEGDIIRQLDEEWNINFYHSRNSHFSQCSKYDNSHE
ncbi:hypothetical protein [Acinetobacter sp. YH12145]|uniref:hypothetical protein n=1 Tax=Acinetobacter sp. YH12145 TaxID=2601129 RepID=UPI0015D1E0A9|nr:hypothetical protein [Acinetobacter sp. YH12145]